jgi:hypothetical protein
MDDPGLNDGKQDRDNPEKQDHPFFEVAVITAVVFRFKERRYRQYGSRETAYEENDIMIPEKTGLVGIMRRKKTPLVFQELIDEPGSSFDGLITIPGEGDEKSYDEE